MTAQGRAKRIGAAEARQTLGQLLDDVRRAEQPVVIEKSGVPLAAVVPLSMLERDRRWAEERAERVALIKRLRRPVARERVEDMEHEVAAAVRWARSKQKRARTPRH